MKNVYDYLISRYGQRDVESNLYTMIAKLEEKVKVLEDKYKDALLDIRRLEEENIETTNVLYEIIHSVDAVDARIDIVMENKQ
jgi:hypothetical protein